MDVPERGITLHQVCIMVASCPSLRCSCRKNLSYTEKQRVWSRSCGLQDLLRNIPFLRCFHVTAAKQWSILMIELLTTVGWKCCQPPGCPCSPNVTTCLSKESIPAIPSRNCKHPLPPVAWCSWELVFYGLLPPAFASYGDSFAAKELLSPLLSPRTIFAHRTPSTTGRIWPLIERFDRCAAVPCDSALICWRSIALVPSKIQDFAEFDGISSLCKGSW